MRALNVLLALVISLVIGLLVLEGGLRLIGMGPTSTMMHFDDVLGWSKKPDIVFEKSNREFDVTYEINSLGLRDDPMSDPSKPANTFRVAMLGDSFTLGLAVNREDLFVDQLERWWRTENRRVDVINAGTEGYSTDQQVRWLQEYGEEFQPDLVLLLAYENDLYWNSQSQYMGKDKPRFGPDGTLDQRKLVDTADKSWKTKFALTKSFVPKPDVSEHFFVPEGGRGPILKEFGPLLLTPPAFMAEVKDHTRGALRALKATCDELGARAVVVPIPSHAVVDSKYRKKFGETALGLPPDRWDPSRPVDTFLALAKEVGLETLDPRTTFKATATGQALYNQVDWHLNPAGNETFARFLHDELDTLGAFPAAHAAPPGIGHDLPEPVASSTGAPFWLRLYAALWAGLTVLYLFTYTDEPKWQPPLKVGLLLSAVFAIVLGGDALLGSLPPRVGAALGVIFVLGLLGFILFKIGRRLSTILELLKAFILRGHWYLMPLVVVLLTIGSLLVVAASSPLVAPFIYTLF